MKKYNVGIIGYGWAAGAHIAAINATSLAEVTAVYSSRKLDPAELRLRYGRPIVVYNEIESLLNEAEESAQISIRIFKAGSPDLDVYTGWSLNSLAQVYELQAMVSEAKGQKTARRKLPT